jgi:hypothetical protein
VVRSRGARSGMAPSLRSGAARSDESDGTGADRAGGAPDVGRSGAAARDRRGVVERDDVVLRRGYPDRFAAWGPMPPPAPLADPGVEVRALDAQPTPELARQRGIPRGLPLGDLIPATTPTKIWNPEHELFAAVLRDALACVSAPLTAATKPKARAQRLVDLAWFGGGPARVPFETVCAALDLEPSAVRRLVATGGVADARARRHANTQV